MNHLQSEVPPSHSIPFVKSLLIAQANNAFNRLKPGAHGNSCEVTDTTVTVWEPGPLDSAQYEVTRKLTGEFPVFVGKVAIEGDSACEQPPSERLNHRGIMKVLGVALAIQREETSTEVVAPVTAA